MGFAKLHSAQVTLLTPHIIDIEVDIANGLHSFTIVGLPNKAVEESRDRVSAAIKNVGLTSPKQKNQKVVISLAPADLKKEGPIFDVPIALAYLLASGDVCFDPAQKIFLGELSLDGEVRAVRGILPLVQKAVARGFTEIFVPYENREEAAIISGITVFGVKKLIDLLAHLDTQHVDTKNTQRFFGDVLCAQPRTEIMYTTHNHEHTLEDVHGQEHAKRALEIAAAGGHSVAMSGPPGTGKTMLAKAFCELLPPLSFQEILEVTAIHSVSGQLQQSSQTLVTQAPFRSPHHNASFTSLIGGGNIPKPGEITLAHRGVLFLDEFPEFDRHTIDSLRQPLEDKIVSVSRAKGTAQFPADFILIAAMNPCPCGFHGVKGKECLCSAINLNTYRRKISGPIIDRIDLWTTVEKVEYKTLTQEHNEQSGEKNTKESVAEIKQRIITAREIQQKRFIAHGLTIKTNSQLHSKFLASVAPLSYEVTELLNTSAQKLDLSARSYYRVWKVARTIADLSYSKNIEVTHMLEALHYRPQNT